MKKSVVQKYSVPAALPHLGLREVVWAFIFLKLSEFCILFNLYFNQENPTEI